MEYQMNIYGEEIPMEEIKRQSIYNTAKQDNIVECYECENPIILDPKQENITYTTMEVYDSPFDENGKTIYLHLGNDDGYGDCLSKLEDTSWADFRYFYCESCDREIIRQNPKNGYMSFIRDLESDFQEIIEVCLKCYEEEIIKNGIPKSKFEQKQIAGMFAPDAEKNGYQAVDGFQSYFINNQESIEKYCNKAMELIDNGYKVLNDYERLGIGGGEGYITMFAKKVNENLKVGPES